METDRQRAEAIIDAWLLPDVLHQQEIRARNEALARAHARNRLVAWCGLIGAAAGALVSALAHTPLAHSIIVGAAPAVAVGVIGQNIRAWRAKNAATRESSETL